jgi:hypothetical protein
MEDHMSQSSVIVDRQSNDLPTAEQEAGLPTLDLVKQSPDSDRLNIEVAMEWAVLGGD